MYLNDDCLNVMNGMVENGEKVDCVVSDVPYGINHKSNARKDKSDTTTSRGIMNDNVDNGEFLAGYARLAYQIMKDNSHIYWFTRWDKLETHVPILRDAGFNVKNCLIWDKRNGGSGDLTAAYRNRYECIVYGMKGRRELNQVEGKWRHDDILEFSKVAASKLVHPHQKPLDLLEFLIRKSTNEGELVFDGFGGVGSTLIAAERCGRRCIAVELDPQVYTRGQEYIEKSRASF